MLNRKSDGKNDHDEMMMMKINIFLWQDDSVYPIQH